MQHTALTSRLHNPVRPGERHSRSPKTRTSFGEAPTPSRGDPDREKPLTRSGPLVCVDWSLGLRRWIRFAHGRLRRVTVAAGPIAGGNLPRFPTRPKPVVAVAVAVGFPIKERPPPPKGTTTLTTQERPRRRHWSSIRPNVASSPISPCYLYLFFVSVRCIIWVQQEAEATDHLTKKKKIPTLSVNFLPSRNRTRSKRASRLASSASPSSLPPAASPPLTPLKRAESERENVSIMISHVDESH